MKKFLLLLFIAASLPSFAQMQPRYHAVVYEFADSSLTSTFRNWGPSNSDGLTPWNQYIFGDGNDTVYQSHQRYIFHTYAQAGWYGVTHNTFLLNNLGDTIFQDSGHDSIVAGMLLNPIYPIKLAVADSFNIPVISIKDSTPQYNHTSSSELILIDVENTLFSLNAGSISTSSQGGGGLGAVVSKPGAYRIYLMRQHKDINGVLVAERFEEKTVYVNPDIDATAQITGKVRTGPGQYSFTSVCQSPQFDPTIHEEYYYWHNNPIINNKASADFVFNNFGKRVVRLNYGIKDKITGDFLAYTVAFDTVDVVSQNVCKTSVQIQKSSNDHKLVNFTNNSAQFYNNAAKVNYLWDFGDGDTSTYKYINLTHRYRTNGTYLFKFIQTVRDTASNIICVDSVIKFITIYHKDSCSARFIVDSISSGQSMLRIYNTSTPVGIDSNVASISYLWRFGDGDTSLLSYPTHTYNNIGTYNLCLSVNVTFTNGQTCYNSYCHTVGVDSLGNFIYKNGANGFTINVINPANIGLDESEEIELSVFPNPATNVLSVKGFSETLSYRLFDLSGKELKAGELLKNNNQISILDLSEGIYILSMEHEGILQSKKIIKH